MILSANHLFGWMNTRWTVRSICNTFGCSSTVASMYYQRCTTPDQVNTITMALQALAD